MISNAARTHWLLFLLASVAVGASGMFSIVYAQVDAPASTPSKARAFTAVGNSTYAAASGCTNISCNSCNFFTLNGRLNSFTSFGPNMVNPIVTICISEDTNNQVPNGNQGTNGTFCAPSSGIVMINGTRGKVIDIRIAGETCTLPNGASTPNLGIVNGAFALKDSNVTTVSRASGGFNAFFNIDGDASVTLTGNFAK
jgi:hypothetical protein